MSLAALFVEARALAGDPLPCMTGEVPHDWISDCAGRKCPHAPEGFACSMTVYRCRRCGDFDYGEIGGPGERECRDYCQHREKNTASK